MVLHSSCVRGLLVLLVLAMFAAAPRRAAADGDDSISRDVLAAAALSPDELPGYHVTSESFVTEGATFEVTFFRVLTAAGANGEGASVVRNTLMVPRDTATVAALRPLVMSGAGLASYSAQASFRYTGSLGIGDLDVSAAWTAPDPANGNADSFYGDAFLRGRLVTIVIYAAPARTADAGRIGALARMQDRKLLDSDDLPEYLVYPDREDASASTPLLQAAAIGSGGTILPGFAGVLCFSAGLSG